MKRTALSRRFRIVAEARILTHKPAGVGTFFLNALQGIGRFFPDWEVTLIASRPFAPQCLAKLRDFPNCRILIDTKSPFSRSTTLWTLLHSHRIVNALHPDLFWGPTTLIPWGLDPRIPTVLNVHDLFYKRLPGTMTWANRALVPFYDFSARRARFLWTISQYSKAEILEFYPGVRAKDIFVGCSIDPSFFAPAGSADPVLDGQLHDLNLPPKYLIFVGSLEPRKNIPFLLSLMPELAARGYSLVVVSGKAWGSVPVEQILGSPGFPRDRVRFLEFLPIPLLRKIYENAALYISTSLGEGFGLPQLEAMACGAPVVCSHNTAMIEVVEGAGLTVRGWKREDWIDAILEVDRNREAYVSRGRARISAYEWESILRGLQTFLHSAGL